MLVFICFLLCIIAFLSGFCRCVFVGSLVSIFCIVSNTYLFVTSWSEFCHPHVANDDVSCPVCDVSSESGTDRDTGGDEERDLM